MSVTASNLSRPSGNGLPRIAVADGTLEMLKWVALVLMTADHINKYLVDEKLAVVFQSARVVMPIFGFVLAVNLARSEAFARGVYLRTLRRLAFFAALASPMFLALNGIWPLNVLWMLFAATAICYCIERGERGEARFRALAIALFVIAGAFVEFWWFGITFVVGAWLYCRRPSWIGLCIWGVGAMSLTVANQNWFALCAVPIIVVAPWIHVRVPRLRWAFYAYYPAHLTVLMVLAHTWRGE